VGVLLRGIDCAMSDATIAFRIPPELAQQAAATARKELMTRSAWLRRLVDRGVREQVVA
jgi:hypothetical protein